MSYDFDPAYSPGRAKMSNVNFTETGLSSYGYRGISSSFFYYLLCNYNRVVLLTNVSSSGKILDGWARKKALSRSTINFGYFFKNNVDFICTTISHSTMRHS